MKKAQMPWLKVRLPSLQSIKYISNSLEGLSTVCENALCPNRGECFNNGVVTFLILGNICTRGCSFCAVSKGHPTNYIDSNEPINVAKAVKRLKLKHVVITSVTRDDLDDGGAGVFIETITSIKDSTSGCTIEVLIPDFNGKLDSLLKVISSSPHIISHNIETVGSLYKMVRIGADYKRSLSILKEIKRYNKGITTKSGLMLGLGEEKDELVKTIEDIKDTGCDILTLGQYLQPTKDKMPVKRYVLNEEFMELKELAITMGFKHVNAGPLVRSSYNPH